MNNISSQTKSIFGGIASLKTIAEKSVYKVSGIVGDVSEKYNNIMTALLEIYNQLGGYAELMDTVENILVKNLDEIEITIKGVIKVAIKQIISCGVEPTIDTVLVNTGVTFNLKNIDPQAFLTIDPESENGNLIYFDNSNGYLSKDFNTFLYAVISNGILLPNSTGYTWNNSDGVPILNVSFKEYDDISGDSNNLTIKVHSNYQDKKLSAFISDYLDSIKLFDNVQLLSSIFDDVLGSKIFSLNKTADQIAGEKIIEKLCADILNNVDETDVIDDSFYIFSNDTYNQLLEDSESKRNGTFSYSGDETKQVKVDENIVNKSLTDLKNSGTLSEQVKVIRTAMDDIVNDVVKNSANINEKDKFSLKLDFIRQILSKLMTTITIFMFSPKIMFLFMMVGKIYNIPESTNIVDFIKKNINIYKIIIVKIRDIIVKELTIKIQEMLAPMISKVLVILNAEKLAIYKKQIDDIRSLIENAVSFVSEATSALDSGKNYVEVKQ
jgi:hypothetical protein